MKDLSKHTIQEFVTTFEHPHQDTIDFNAVLYTTLNEETTSTKTLKQSAKNVEYLLSSRSDFCEDVGFFTFQKYLLDIESKQSPLLLYIKNMPATFGTKHKQDLKRLSVKYNKTNSIWEAVRACYYAQKYITIKLSELGIQSTTKFHQQEKKYQDIFAPKTIPPTPDKNPHVLHDDVFGFFEDDKEKEYFTKQLMDEEIYAKEDEKMWEIINNKYVFTSQGVPVLKSTFDPLHKRANNK